MTTLARLPLFDRLAGARTVLIAGAGGGFDVYAGLPLALALRAQGKVVHFANWSFSELQDPDFWVVPGLAEVWPGSAGDESYFPERTLARWLAGSDIDSPVYALDPTGVRPLRLVYEELARRLSLDAVVLVDGGTDILLRGDESSLGTPVEDMTSLAALAGLTSIATRVVVSIGFGIDSYHGVNHVQVLENIAALTRSGAYLGVFSVPPDSPEALGYLEAVRHAATATPGRPSIVNSQIAASMQGLGADALLSRRTLGSDLFINPLMSLYFCFDLDGLAAHNLYLGSLSSSMTTREVALAIEGFRNEVQPRTALPYPH